MKKFEEILSKISQENGLSEDECFFSFNYILEGKATDVQIEKFLLGLRGRGETIQEITAATKVMREKSSKVSAPNNAIDTCGTGGSGSGKYNISTAASLVAAGAGSIIAKHGNRSLSSKSGSSQVLEELGVKLDIESRKITECMEKSNIGFMFAPIFHPAMKYAGPHRREIGIRTVFNILGPLTNPAGVSRQVLGVADKSLGEKMAAVLDILGSQKSLVVNSQDGLDEISICGDTNVWELSDGRISAYKISPEDLGFSRVSPEAIKVNTIEENLSALNRVLSGEKGPYRDVVLVNAAAALLIGEKVNSLEDGVGVAAESIDSGCALATLRDFVKTSQKLSA